MGRKKLPDDERKNRSAPLRVLLSDPDRERLNQAAVLAGEPRTATWARGLLFTVADRIEEIVAYCAERDVSVEAFLEAAIERQLSRKKL